MMYALFVPIIFILSIVPQFFFGMDHAKKTFHKVILSDDAMIEVDNVIFDLLMESEALKRGQRELWKPDCIDLKDISPEDFDEIISILDLVKKADEEDTKATSLKFNLGGEVISSEETKLIGNYMINRAVNRKKKRTVQKKLAVLSKSKLVELAGIFEKYQFQNNAKNYIKTVLAKKIVKKSFSDKSYDGYINSLEPLLKTLRDYYLLDVEILSFYKKGESISKFPVVESDYPRNGHQFFSQDGSRYALQYKKKLYIANLNKPKHELKPFIDDRLELPVAFSFSADNSTCAFVGTDGTICCVDTETMQNIKKFRAGYASQCITFDPSKPILISYFNKRIELIDQQGFSQQTIAVEDIKGDIEQLACSPDGKYLWAISRYAGRDQNEIFSDARLYHLREKKPPQNIKSTHGDKTARTCLLFSNNNRYSFIVQNNYIHMVDLVSFEQKRFNFNNIFAWNDFSDASIVKNSLTSCTLALRHNEKTYISMHLFKIPFMIENQDPVNIQSNSRYYRTTFSNRDTISLIPCSGSILLLQSEKDTNRIKKFPLAYFLLRDNQKFFLGINEERTLGLIKFFSFLHHSKKGTVDLQKSKICSSAYKKLSDKQKTLFNDIVSIKGKYHSNAQGKYRKSHQSNIILYHPCSSALQTHFLSLSSWRKEWQKFALINSAR